jgi:lysozyme
MAPTKTSAEGEAFIVDLEDCPTRAYKDVGGVVTIGPGLTMLSKTFKEYWLRTRGAPLRAGDILPKVEAMKVFRSVLAEEYVPPVLANIAPKEQHHLDGASSVSWNCGPASTRWKWAVALAAGKIEEAATLLLTTAVTAGGRPVRGLRNRRVKEARLIKTGDYGSPSISLTEGATSKGPSGRSTTAAEIREYQEQLKKLGYYSGEIDGDAGTLTLGAVKNFQRSHGLKVDGIVGPATRAALRRALTDANQGKTTAGGAATGTGGGLALDIDPWLAVGIGVGLIVLIFVAFTLYKNRGVILGRRTPA